MGERAIAVLKKQAFTRKQESLVQISAVAKLTLIPEEAKRAINAFLQQDPDEGLAVSAPEAAGYEFQSQGVIEMLEKLLDKFIEERTVLEKEEMNSKQAFDMLVQDLAAQIDQLEASIAKLTEDIAELTKAVSELDAAMSKATKIRGDEKATNTETIADSQAAQTAVAQALN